MENICTVQNEFISALFLRVFLMIMYYIIYTTLSEIQLNVKIGLLYPYCFLVTINTTWHMIQFEKVPHNGYTEVFFFCFVFNVQKLPCISACFSSLFN